MDSGLALPIMALAGLGKSGKFKTDKKLFASLAGLLCTCIAVDAYFIGCEVLTMAYPGADHAVLRDMFAPTEGNAKENAMDQSQWTCFSKAYGFLGNTFLLPMTRTEKVGLDPSFWGAMPDFGSERCKQALDDLVQWSRRQKESSASEEKAATAVAVEYTKLFVGPPSPAAPPWETLHTQGNSSVGFGAATVAMRQELQEAGLAVVNENHQYEDHIGIELLYLCEICRRNGTSEAFASEHDTACFIRERPLSWIGKLEQSIHNHLPDGYFELIARYARCVLEAQIGSLGAEEGAC